MLNHGSQWTVPCASRVTGFTPTGNLLTLLMLALMGVPFAHQAPRTACYLLRDTLLGPPCWSPLFSAAARTIPALPRRPLPPVPAVPLLLLLLVRGGSHPRDEAR